MTRPKRFAPSVQSLDDRITPAVTFSQVGTTLTITGDGENDTVMIRDTGGNGLLDLHVISNGPGGVLEGHGFGNVVDVNVGTQGGSDYVRYELVQNFRGTEDRYVHTWLGSDYDPTDRADRYEAILDPGLNVESGGNLYLGVQGGAGNDYETVTADGFNVNDGGWFKTDIGGGTGDDVIAQFARGGVVHKSFAMRSYGDAGNDTIRQVMQFAAGSTGGLVGVGVHGGDGDDTLSLDLVLSGATLVGPSGVWGEAGADTLNVTPVPGLIILP